jgi:hypothetical protein
MGLVEMFVVALLSIGVMEDVVIPVGEATWENLQEAVNAD